MAFARDRYTAAAGQTDFEVSFTPMETDHIEVLVNGVEKTITTDYTFPSTGLLRFNSGLTEGDAVLIRRNSSQDARIVDYSVPGILTETDLDNDSQQAFNMAQEAIDIANESMVRDSSNNWEGSSVRIANVDDPVNAQDVVTKAYGEANYGGAAVTQAEAARDLAIAAKTAAETAETNAETAETNAEAARDAALAAVGTVKVSSDDTTAAELDTKLLAGTGITKTTGNPAGNETLTFAADIASQAEAEAGTATDKVMTPQRTAQTVVAKSTSLLILSSNSTGPGQNVTTYLWTTGHSDGEEGASGRRGIPMPFACVVKNLYVTVTDAPGSGQSFTYTLRKNGVDQDLAAVITGTARTANDTDDSVTFAAGDELTVKLVTSATATASAAHTAVLEIEPIA